MTALKDKEIYELTAQHEWQAYKSSDLVDALYDYWRGFRYWDQIKEVIPFADCQSVLDVGCGVTSVLNVVRRDFPHLALIGVDPLMEEYQKLYDFDPSITWKRQYLEDLELPAGSFDVVCCTNTLDHVEDVEAAIREIGRVLSPRGAFLLTLDVFAKEKARNAGHPYSFTKDAVRTLLQRCGLRIDWGRLSRRKLGVTRYAKYRMRYDMSDGAIFWKAAVRAQLRCYLKQLLGRGAIGELVLVARAD